MRIALDLPQMLSCSLVYKMRKELAHTKGGLCVCKRDLILLEELFRVCTMMLRRNIEQWSNVCVYLRDNSSEQVKRLPWRA